MQRLPHFLFHQVEHGIAARPLIARRHQSIQRQRVVLRGRAEDTNLNWVEFHGLRVPHLHGLFPKSAKHYDNLMTFSELPASITAINWNK